VRSWVSSHLLIPYRGQISRFVAKHFLWFDYWYRLESLWVLSSIFRSVIYRCPIALCLKRPHSHSLYQKRRGLTGHRIVNRVLALYFSKCLLNRLRFNPRFRFYILWNIYFVHPKIIEEFVNTELRFTGVWWRFDLVSQRLETFIMILKLKAPHLEFETIKVSENTPRLLGGYKWITFTSLQMLCFIWTQTFSLAMRNKFVWIL
jgi:hypothetical protein